MNRKWLVAGGLALMLAVVTIAVVDLRGKPGQGGGEGAPESGRTTTARPVTDAKAAKPAAHVAPPGVEPLPEIDPTKDPAAVQDEILSLSSQYDASAVRPLAAYLYHSDPEIREATRRGLIQLGEADAIPYLRAAAKEELDPAVAKELTEAADFLALPPMKIVPKPKKK
jgi:hypothetical protein